MAILECVKELQDKGKPGPLKNEIQYRCKLQSLFAKKLLTQLVDDHYLTRIANYEYRQNANSYRYNLTIYGESLYKELNAGLSAIKCKLPPSEIGKRKNDTESEDFPIC